MTNSASQLERNVHRFAMIVAAVVALGIPTGFWLVAYQNLSESLEFKAMIKASALSTMIASNPEMWQFAENRVQGLISREPVPLGEESVQVLDRDGAIVTQTGDARSTINMHRAYPLYDAGRYAGQLVVTSSVRGLIQNTLLVALLGSMVGAIVYLAMKSFPLKALRAATDALFREKERAEKTLSSIGDAVITTDIDGQIEYMNPAAERLLGGSENQFLGKYVADVIRLRDSDAGASIESSLYRALRTNTIASCEGNNEVRRTDGSAVPVEERAAPINDLDGFVSGGVIVMRDVSSAREYVRRRSWEATHDSLTELANRREFERQIRYAVSDSHATGRSHILCYMDLDGFKLINDSCGHGVGDELLIQLSKLMQQGIRRGDTLARLGGDEFGLLLVGCSLGRGQMVAGEILAAVDNFQFIHGSQLFKISVSIGLTVVSGEHAGVSDVLGEADCACYWAKEQGKNRLVTFVASDMQLAARRSETGWVSQIKSALQEDRFVLFHQNYRALNSSKGDNDHLEVLIRMVGENGKIIAPGFFLPAAERYNLIPEIDRWVIHEVFSRYDSLVAQRGGKVLTCGINLSGASINAVGLIEFIRDQMNQYKLRPGAICFELTETVAVNNLQTTAEFIRECKLIGCLFALDDFGVGASSFGYLKNLPVDYLKIDGSFVKDMEDDKIDETMVETINRIGHLLGKKTIAEFAENQAIVDKLTAIGVDFAQGYGVCRPEPLFVDSPL